MWEDLTSLCIQMCIRDRSNDIKMNLTEHKVYIKDELVQLTPSEYKLLSILMNNSHQVLSRMQMCIRDRPKALNIHAPHIANVEVTPQGFPVISNIVILSIANITAPTV